MNRRRPRPTSSGSTTPCRRAPAPQGDGPWKFVGKPDHPVYQRAAVALRQQGRRALASASSTTPAPKLAVGEGDTLFAYVYLDPADPPRELMLQWHTAATGRTARTGARTVIDWGKDGTPERLRDGRRCRTPASGCGWRWPRPRLKLTPDLVIDGWAFTQHGGTVYWDKAGIATRTPQDGQLFDSLVGLGRRPSRPLGGAGLPEGHPGDSFSSMRSKRTDSSDQASCAPTSSSTPTPRRADQFAPLLRQLAGRREGHSGSIDRQVPTTLVFREKAGEPKPAYLLKRGEYDQRGEKVGRAAPAFLPPLPPGAPVNRLGLAQWLVAPNHPLTARVAVNRFWHQVFGTGIVKTAEDFGTQGEPPSHPELLDWLAVQFREDGWDVKRIDEATGDVGDLPAVVAGDARAAGEGPGQPAAVARAAVPARRRDAARPGAVRRRPAGRDRSAGRASSRRSRPGCGRRSPTPAATPPISPPTRGAEKVHRRSLYTFWKRTSPPPQMTTFDAPSREACTVRRERTNTPLQALLHDERAAVSSRPPAPWPSGPCARAGPTADDRLAYMFRLATARMPGRRRDWPSCARPYKDLPAHYTQRAPRPPRS